MRAKWIFAILVLFSIAGGVTVAVAPELIAAHPYISAATFTVPSLLFLWLLYLNLVRPISAVTNGMELLRGQDFNSRLVSVGQKDADHLVGMFNKILSRLKEERLKNIEQNHFLQLLIQTSPTGIIIFDFDEKITLINPAMLAMFGGNVSAQDAEGKEISDFDCEIAKEVGETQPGETRIIRISGTMIVRISRLSFMERGFRRPYVTVETLTKEVMLAEKEAYGKVIRMLSHEVNNTIAGVNSILETLSVIVEYDSDLKEVVDSCRERCGSLGKFISSYADVVRAPQFNPVCIELNSRVARMIPFLEGLCGESVVISFTPAVEDVFVDADPVLLEQVMVNIIKNAKESILSVKERGEIKITVDGSPARIEVTDDGAGVSKEASSKIFSPFFSTKRGGQGVGLMMVSEILRLHGAKFSLRTDTFSVTRPLTRFEIEFP